MNNHAPNVETLEASNVITSDPYLPSAADVYNDATGVDVGSPLVGADAPLRVEIEVDDFPLITRPRIQNVLNY